MYFLWKCLCDQVFSLYGCYVHRQRYAYVSHDFLALFLFTKCEHTLNQRKKKWLYSACWMKGCYWLIYELLPTFWHWLFLETIWVRSLKLYAIIISIYHYMLVTAVSPGKMKLGMKFFVSNRIQTLYDCYRYEYTHQHCAYCYLSMYSIDMFPVSAKTLTFGMSLDAVWLRTLKLKRACVLLRVYRSIKCLILWYCSSRNVSND